MTYLKPAKTQFYENNYVFIRNYVLMYVFCKLANKNTDTKKIRVRNIQLLY